MDPDPIYAELTAGAHDADRRGGLTVLELLAAVDAADEEAQVGRVPGVLTFPVA